MTNPDREELVKIADLRSANVARQQEWDAGNQLTLAYRGNELAGEVGEACNVIKKLERERLGIAGSRDTVAHLAEELADVVICADLIAMHEGIDLLGEAVPAKFNATSEKVGLKTRLYPSRRLAEAGTQEAVPITAQQMDAIEQAAIEGKPLSDVALFERHTGFRLKITDTAPPAPSVAVKVKALEWDEHRTAQCALGVYDITGFSSKEYCVTKPNGHRLSTMYPDVESAKAAAQADYEDRIKSALIELPAGKGEPEPVAWIDFADSGNIRLWTSEKRRYDAETALGRKMTPVYTAPPANAGMREAFVRVLASLAAAISILERTPKAKKAVASDKMFDAMLDDYRKALEAGRAALTAPGATTKSDVEALAATTAERPGTVTSEPEPSTSDTPPVPQAVKAVGVDTIARICADDLVPIIETATRVANRTGNTFVIDRQKVATMIAGHFNRALLAKFKKEGR